MRHAFAAPALAPPLAAAVAVRLDAGTAFFDAEAERLARLCHLMAERLARGGRLIATGATPTARSDARHVAVEFVHPVIVGKRALPAIACTAEGGDLAGQLTHLARPEDIVLAFGDALDRDAAACIALGRRRGCLTIATAAIGAEYEFLPPVEDSLIAQELVETLYHVLWELVHVFFEHRGLLDGRSSRPHHDAGASAFLYPFLDEREAGLEAVLDDVTRSVRMKSAETGELRRRTLTDGGETLRAAGLVLRGRLAAGGTLFALGNGGSATDAMDAVADFRAPLQPGGPAWAAVDLTEDTGILTAVANDVGAEAIFLRQVIALAAPGDALLALSTSGGSGNVLAALAEARRRDLLTIALVGYDGGRIAAEGLADHVVIAPSQHIPRIQEAQASALHVLREFVG